LRLFSFGGYGLALAALALVVFGAIECPLFFCFRTASLGGSVLKEVKLGFVVGKVKVNLS